VKPIVATAFGALFGVLLSRARATDYDAITGMFLLRDLHLMGVIGVAVVTAALGMAVLRARGRAQGIQPKPYHRLVFAGGLIVGIGWALSGACPGTALAQIGEGKLYALATVLGLVAGTWLRMQSAAPARTSGGAARPAGTV
jgi:hypothetical protein